MAFYVTAAEARLRWAPGEGEPETVPVTVGLLRDAVMCLLRALHHARNPEAELAADGVTVEALHASLDETGLLAASDDRSPLLRAAFLATDCVAFDRMKSDDLERLRQTLDGLTRPLRARIDLRTDAHFRRLGVARVAVVSLLALYALVMVGGRLLRGENVARGRPVKMSSQQPGTPNPAELVDGVVGGRYGAHTLVGGPTPPWIVVDLQRSRHVRKIVVYNRGDQNLDQCLPYAVSVSEDGRAYKEVARRETHFGSGDFLSSPWTIAADVSARYVRIEANGYIALSELEVFE